MSRPQVYIVVSVDKPGEPHVAGAFTTWEQAKDVREELGMNNSFSALRSKWHYNIWQLPFDKPVVPPVER